MNSFSLHPPPFPNIAAMCTCKLKVEKRKDCGQKVKEIGLVFKFWDWKDLVFFNKDWTFLDRVGKRLSTLNQSLSSSILICHCKMYTIPIPLPSGEIFSKRVDFSAIFEKETLNIKLTSSGYMTVEGWHADRSLVYYCLELILSCLVFVTHCYYPLSHCPVSSV